MRFRGALFVLLLGLVVLANVLVVVPEFWNTRLWEDEGYNLTVPLNLLAGHGYTSDGILAHSATLTPFDARISTGPVVLLPVAGMLATGIDMVVGARLVMFLFYVALLVGLWVAGRRIGGRWGGLIAVAVPIALNTNQLPSPIQGPIDILGEIPAAALLVFAFLFVQRRPWLGGLMLGLAVQTKLISGLAVPALVLMALFSAGASRGSIRSSWLRRLWPFVAAALAPTVLFELVQLVSLGAPGFLSSTRDFLYFLKSGGQVGFDVSPVEKAGTLVASWYLPAILTLVLCALSLVVGVLAWRVIRVCRDADAVSDFGARTFGQEVLLLLGGAALTFVLWCGWWLASVHTPDWVRYAVPGLLATVPILAAGVVLGIRVVWKAGPAWRAGARVWMRGIAAITVMAIGAAFVVQASMHVVQASVPDYGESLSSQRAAARAMGALGQERLVSVWGPQIGAIVLSGARVVPQASTQRGATPMVIWNYDQSAASLAQFDANIKASCSRVLLRLDHYAVCVPSQ